MKLEYKIQGVLGVQFLMENKWIIDLKLKLNMIEAIAILATGAAILLYTEMKSNKETIEKQSRRIRHLTGNQNEEDKLESKNLLEAYLFDMILYKIQNEDCFFKWLDKDIQIEEAKRLFENKYGHKFSDPFNKY